MKNIKSKPGSTTEEFVAALANENTEQYLLRLYITGTTPRSIKAITNIKRICEENLEDRYNLEVIDIYQKPSLAKDEQIIATPTLIKKLPLPLTRIIGDLSDSEKVLFGLDLKKVKKHGEIVAS